jgi:thiamine pyrophosphokinase
LRVVIFANGELIEPKAVLSLLKPDDYLVAVDGGGRHCITLGIQPKVVIGDLDSLSDSEIAQLKKGGAEIVPYSPEKDETDLELALGHALKKGARKVLVIAALGGRWDMSIANLLLPAALNLQKLNLEFRDGRQQIYPVFDQVEFEGRIGSTVSLIPIGGNVTGVVTSGLKYALRGESLYFGLTRGVSNVMEEKTASVKVDKGILLCFVTNADGI